jgi:GNAT superfamily N-acetyltransferase
MQARGASRWVYFVRHKDTGALAGYTEIITDRDTPDIAFQGDTGVLERYRGHGLGKWLKAAMLEKLLKEQPQVKFVRTGNADSNAAMLGINTKLGFKPYSAETLWQVELDKIEAYLREKALPQAGR